MSGIAALYNVPLVDSEFLQWSFVNASAHRDINRVIFQLIGTQLDEFILDPFNPNNSGVWLYQHQLMHQQMDAILGIDGFDLLDVDFTDPNNLAGWVFLHASEHVQAADILRIG